MFFSCVTLHVKYVKATDRLKCYLNESLFKGLFCSISVILVVFQINTPRAHTNRIISDMFQVSPGWLKAGMKEPSKCHLWPL